MTQHEDLTPKFKASLLTKMQQESPFWELLGLELADVKKGWAKVRLPFDAGEMMAEARIVHKGAKTALGDVEVRNGDGTLIAKGLATYMILKKDEFIPIPSLE